MLELDVRIVEMCGASMVRGVAAVASTTRAVYSELRI
jgi:hypothetical protein